MAKKSYFVRYTTIVKELKKGEKSFSAISKAIEDAYRDYGLDSLTYSLRTFQRDINDILSLFEIEIACNSESFYYIKNNDSVVKELNMRMIESFDLLHTMRYRENIEQFIQLQPSSIRGEENFAALLSACELRKAVRFSYRYVWKGCTKVCTVYPYGLKEFEKLWYLVAWSPNEKAFRTYGLDRILDLEVTENHFDRQPNFSMEAYFRYCYGIGKAEDEEENEPACVLLQSTSQYANYLKALPLHPSQRIVEEDVTGTLFELKLYPSWVFIQKLMTMADQVQVLEPDSLRESLMDALREGYEYQEEIDY